MFPFVRTHRFAAIAIAIAGVGVFGGIALLAARVFIDNGVGKGDPDPQGDSIIAVCSDVPFHVRYIVNVGTETRPDDRTVSEEARMPNGHGRDPFDRHRGCPRFSSAFGSRVDFRVPDLNGRKPFSATAPADRKHCLVVRFTKNADGTVTETQEPAAAPAS